MDIEVCDFNLIDVWGVIVVDVWKKREKSL